ncbi:glycosyltransferase family 1 protein [Streptacidiphilus pinicola]|uniref:Glycosyltransferase family 1 protein n=1 Tax=Streptacidiphilus pinicola TaxID=2219663 RepID=A0A2X0IFA2_9ACTN|nr:glycosyltransferase family 4 protein [Streptacidiphilus pinicola]RAG83732.1 glycosyltransferase family 1 protein [Streptacidiphilus pinicola]
MDTSGVLRPPSRENDTRASTAARAHVAFLSLRDLASPAAGGSELLIDKLAAGLARRGHPTTLVCGGPVGSGRPYRVRRNGGPYSQFLTAPRAVRSLDRVDLLVEVCNGLPYFAPAWSPHTPAVCLVNHVHRELWPLRYPWPIAALGRYAETVLLPRVHRGNLFVAVSDSTAQALADIGVARERIRVVTNGVEDVADPAALPSKSAEPLFLALGRLAEYKRIDVLLRLWERVRPVTGGTLVIAGDGPERERLEAMAGPGVHFTGRISEQRKHELLCRAWVLLHPSQVEGWGLVVTEAAVRRTPTVGFRIPGLTDSVEHDATGLLAPTEGAFASAWAGLALDPVRRHAMGAAARGRALGLRWHTTVERFAAVVDEALHRTAPAPR